MLLAEAEENKALQEALKGAYQFVYAIYEAKYLGALPYSGSVPNDSRNEGGKKMKNASKLVAAVLVLGLLTGCKGNAAKTTDPSDALLATETTAATTATKPTTKATTKPTTKPTTGKTETTKATEATKPAESQKPAASEPAATQKPSESPKANEAPKPTNPPTTQPPATEAPKPTNPPETEPPETEPPVVSLSIDEAISYGRQYIQSLGAILDTDLAYDDPGYYPAGYTTAETQSELNNEVIWAIDSDLATLKSRVERSGYEFNIADIRLDVFIEQDGDNGYYITVYYG